MKLYHGSPRKLKEESLVPRKPIDLEDNPDNIIKGVYATDLRDSAIAMAIVSCQGVRGASLNMSENLKIPGIIYHGFPNQKYIFLYTLNPKKFKSSGIHQFVSETSIKPMKIEKLEVKDYFYLVRKANEKEVKEWDKKLNKWMKSDKR